MIVVLKFTNTAVQASNGNVSAQALLAGAAIGSGKELAGDAATGASNFSLVANSASVALLASGALPAAAFCKSAALTADIAGVGLSAISGDKDKIASALILLAVDVAPGFVNRAVISNGIKELNDLSIHLLVVLLKRLKV